MSNADNMANPAATKPTRALVTGGGGFLGFAVVKLLLAAGYSVKTFSRATHPKLAFLNVTQITGDLADFDLCNTAAADTDVVFHTAAKAGAWGKYADYYNTNTQGTQNIINACLQNGVKHLVYTSSPSVVFNGRPIEGGDETLPYPTRFESMYSATKALAEQKVKAVNNPGLHTVILRPHDIWGPGDPHFVPRILARRHKLKIIGSGNNLVDAVYIDNAARAHWLAYAALVQNPALNGRVYFITNDEPMPAWDIINKILELGGYPPVTKRVSLRTACAAGAVMENIWRILKFKGEPRITRFLALALGQAHWFNISAAKRDLNYHPHITMTEGFKRLGAWMTEQNMVNKKRTL